MNVGSSGSANGGKYLALETLVPQILVSSLEHLPGQLRITLYHLNFRLLIVILLLPLSPRDRNSLTLEKGIRNPHLDMATEADEPLIQAPRLFPFTLLRLKIDVSLPQKLRHGQRRLGNTKFEDTPCPREVL